MIRIEVIMAENDIAKVSEGLKSTGVGGLTVFKVKGRGKTVPKEIHASKGTQIFTPEFGDKYVVVAVLPDEKMNEAIKIVRENSKIGKIFVTPVTYAIDLATGVEDEKAI
ncbi:MAG TPA: P-II family nitrogen regulator [Nitrososphaeraceae archaeon]